MEIDTDEIKKEKGHDMLLQKIHAERQHIRDLRVVLRKYRDTVFALQEGVKRYKWRLYAALRLKRERAEVGNLDVFIITEKRKVNDLVCTMTNFQLRVRVVKEKIKNAQRRLSRLSAKFKAQSSEE